MAAKAKKVSGVTLDIQNGTERTMYATWKWSQSHTASYTVNWYYATGDGVWFVGSSTSVNAKQAVYTAPSNATKVKVQIKPVSTTHKVNKKDTYYWTAGWSTAKVFEFKAGKVPDAGTVTGLTVNIQSGTDRTMFATWKWDQSNTDYYQVKWEYATGDGTWFTGNDGNATEKESLYTAPSNATKVRVKVKPVAKTHTKNGKEVAYWSSSWCTEVKFEFKADAIPDAGKVSGLKLDLQTGTERTLFATWQFNQTNVASYSLLWSYDSGDGIWFENNEETTSLKQATYSAPANAVQVRLQVRANALTHLSNGVEVAYWTSDWCDAVTYVFKDLPEVPSVPTVTVDKYNLLAEVESYDANAVQIEFQVVANNTTVFASGIANVVMNHASFSCPVNAGSEYKVRCRGIKGSDKSDWSAYSQSKGTIPATPGSITACRALSATSVEISWSPAANAESYDIEYTTKKSYFDSSNEVKSASVEAIVQHAELTGLESGVEWFFRVRAVNSNGASGWCSPVSIILGKKPAAPTTWSQTTTGIVGRDLVLYWVHNSEDGSSQRFAQIEISVNGVTNTVTIETSVNEDEPNPTNSYVLSTSSYTEGAKVRWRVRTMGIINEYGDWSTQRTIDVYAPPTLVLGSSGTNNWFWDTFNFRTDTIYTAYGTGGELLEVLRTFPYYISATAGPATQTPVGYYLTISSKEKYETVNNVGETVWVNEGEEVYAKYFDGYGDHLFAALTASDIDLEDGISYLIHCLVYMDSGLTAEAEAEFRVEWNEEEYGPDAEIGIDPESVMAHIRPYCEDDEGILVEDVLLSVYRREFDGTFTEIASGIQNQRTVVEPLLDSFGDYMFDSSGRVLNGREVDEKAIYITDPHPALDYARYRIIAMSTKTGAISYYDPPGIPVGEVAAILQWDEEWSSFDAGQADEDEFEKPPWSGTMLKLPYNLDVADNGGTEVSLINYIGREHPVTYYGTQRGSTSTWNVEVVKEDVDTLYLLRRLQRYAGDVYVREPSGSGYWANVVVSFSQKHCELTIPVTLNITRVEGGV